MHNVEPASAGSLPSRFRRRGVGQASSRIQADDVSRSVLRHQTLASQIIIIIIVIILFTILVP